MKTIDVEVLKDLVNIVGEENILKDEVDLMCYSRDCTPYFCMPEVVVYPETVNEVSEIVKLANRRKIPITPRGGGASVTGSSLPRYGGILLSLVKMNKIKEIRPEDFYVIAEAGVLLKKLNEILSKYDLIFPHDVGSADACTLGGLIASNAHGHHGFKYGCIRDWVLSLEVVLPNGDIIRTGSNVLRSNCGYDLTRLFIGSQGTLGVITEATLRVMTTPKYKASIAAFFDRIEYANKAIIKIVSSGAEPSTIELVNRFVLKSANDEFKLNFPDAETMVVVDIDGDSEPSVKPRIEKIIDICIKEKSQKVYGSDEPSEIEKFWKPRLYLDLAISRRTQGKTNIGCLAVTDPCVPLSKIAYVVKALEEIYQKHGLIVGIAVHAGVGIIHPMIYIDVLNREEWKKAKKAEKEVIGFIKSVGGTITGEHNVGLIKIPYTRLELGNNLELMKKIKTLLDPNNIMNPGKLGLDVEDRDSSVDFAYPSYCLDLETNKEK
jgi:glycolate oxidase